MPRHRTILALGNLHPERRKRFEAFAKETSFELAVFEGLDAAFQWLESNDPRVVLFDTSVAKAHTLCLRVRAKKALSTVPIIGLARVITDDAMSKLFAAGADDVVSIAARDSLLVRLRAVPLEQSFHPPPDRGRALVADRDHDRCSVIGRTLMSAGYEVRFAIDRRSLDHYSQDPDTRLVVASAEMGTPSTMIEGARKSGGVSAVWLITDIERDVAAGVDPVPGVDRAMTVSASMPPESLLFLSNEMLCPQEVSKRMTPRLLHGTVVAFREAGAEEDDLGFTYNVSTNGVFVRTLAPPCCKSVWIELRPPGSEHRVRLQGEIAWTRPFSPGKFALTPPGFGVQIACGLADGAELWAKAVERLVSSARKRHRLEDLLEETLRDSVVDPVEAAPPAPEPAAPSVSQPAAQPATQPAAPPAPPTCEVSSPQPSEPPPLPLVYADPAPAKQTAPAKASVADRRSRRLLVMAAAGALLFCAGAAAAYALLKPSAVVQPMPFPATSTASPGAPRTTATPERAP